MTFQASGDTMWGYMHGYSLDCASCEGNFDYWTSTTFDYTNTTAETVDVHAFIQNQTTAGADLTATVSMIPLPDGDTCVGAIDVDEAALPYTWSDTSPLFIHSCAASVCPSTSGPDVWHEITVPPGDVLRVEKTAGPSAYLAAVSQCTDTTALFFSTDPEILVWQNIDSVEQTVYVVAGAVSSSSIATLELVFEIETPVAGDFCGSAIPVAYNDTAAKTGDWADFGDYFWGGTDCGAAAGAEVWFAVEVPSGEKLTIDETSTSDTTLQVLMACDAGECVESSLSEVAIYLNNTTEDQTVYVAVESATETATAESYAVSFAWETPPVGDLCLDPIEVLLTDDTWSGVWNDYMDSSSLSTANGCGYANGRDVWFEVWVGAGEKLTMSQESPIPTVLQIVDDCGDDAACSDWGYDEVVWYNTGTVDATVIIGVEAISAIVTSGPIELVFDRELTPVGDSCDTAHDVDEASLPFTDEPVLWMYDSAWPGSWCTPASGSDVWYAVDVPPDQVVFFDELSSADTVLHLATDCPPTGCVASADQPETVNWYNSTSGTVTAYAVAKAKYAADNGATLSVAIDVGPASDGDFCSNAIDLTAETMPHSWSSGDLSDFTDGFTGLMANDCAEVTGSEVWFALLVPAGYWLNVGEDSPTPVVIQILESCTTQTCLASSGESIFWQNEDTVATTVYVVIEGDGVNFGELDVTFDTIDAPPTMFGPTPQSAGYWGATDDDTSMCPDITSSGTDLDMWDDDEQSVDLGISFELFGETHTTAWVASNGNLSFGTFANSSLSGSIPSDWYDDSMTAVYWDDLDPTAGGGVYVETIGNTFVVQWNVPPFGSMSSGLYDVRAVLDGSSGMIHYCYVDTEIGDTWSDFGNSAASGIQGSSSEYLAYSNSEPILTEGLHVWFVAP
jgi:hypothetical protein